MLYIFDRHDNLIEQISIEDYENFTHTDKINGEASYRFETNINKNLVKYNKVGFFNEYNEFQLFYIEDVIEFKSLSDSKMDVECLCDFYKLGNTIIEDKRVINGSLRDAATKALEGTNYKVGIVEDFELKNINFYFCSSLKAIQDILNVYGCEMKVRIEINEDTGKISNKYIDFVHRLGEDTGLRFTYDTALDSVEKSYVEGHYNVLYGRGKAIETENGGYSRKLDFSSVNNGKKYIEDLESIAKYGRLEGIFEDGNIEDPQILLEKTKEKLELTRELKISYKVSVNDLSEIDGFEHYKSKKGDTIIILDEEEELVIEARIIEKRNTDEDTILILGNLLPGYVENDEAYLGGIKDKIDIIENAPITDNKYPDTLPNSPTLKANGLYSTVALEWTFENKSYYTYELYASKIKNFNPDSTNKIFEGKASAFLHEVKPSETWYYRARAKNTHGKYTNFSPQISAITNKISDAAEFFEQASIADAIIGELRLDRGWVGKLVGEHIDARNLSVTDGNGKKTLDIDSLGNVSLDVTSLRINSKEALAEGEAITDINVTPGNLKIKSDKIQLDGATTIGDSEGHNIKIENANYSIWQNGKKVGYLGFQPDKKGAHPKLTMGWNGIDVNKDDYFTLHAYPTKANAENSPHSYADLAYRCINLNDWSNIKMYGDGRITLAPLTSLEITTNSVNGVYEGTSERRLCLFDTSSSQYFNSNLQIPAVRNKTSGYGLILADDHEGGGETRVRVQWDGTNRFFRPLTTSANIDLGSSGYRWKKVFSDGGVGYSVTDVDTARNITYMDSSIDSVIDTLDFDMNIFRSVSTDSSDIQLNLNVAKLKEHPLSDMFLNNTEEYNEQTEAYEINTTADMTSLLHLALYELQKQKKEIEQLKNTQQGLVNKAKSFFISKFNKFRRLGNEE